MKKILWIMVVCFLVVGCNQKEVTYQLDSLEKEFLEIDSSFETSKKMDSETLKRKYDFDTNNMKEFLILLPTMVDKSNMYMVVKPKKGKTKEVKEEINKFFTSYELQFSLYFPEEEEKIKNRIEEEQDGYLFYIVSEYQEKNDKLYQTK